jgi:hypothetical protein
VVGEGNRREVERGLLETAGGLNFQNVQVTVDGSRIRMQFFIAPEILSRVAWALIYAFGAQSFATARPAMNPPNDADEWTLADSIGCLLFENGRLYFHASEVRGRLMNTTIELDSDGIVVITTVDRGEALTRWMMTLRGENFIKCEI